MSSRIGVAAGYQSIGQDTGGDQGFVNQLLEGPQVWNSCWREILLTDLLASIEFD